MLHSFCNLPSCSWLIFPRKPGLGPSAAIVCEVLSIGLVQGWSNNGRIQIGVMVRETSRTARDCIIYVESVRHRSSRIHMKPLIAAPGLCLGPQIVGEPGPSVHLSGFAVAIALRSRAMINGLAHRFPRFRYHLPFHGASGSRIQAHRRDRKHMWWLSVKLRVMIVSCHLQEPVHREAREMH